MEKIKCAAIKYRPLATMKEDIVTGPNHAECINYFMLVELYAKDRDMGSETQGFMTTKNRFVDRKEAYKIAKAAGQLLIEKECSELDSYNCNFETN